MNATNKAAVVIFHAERTRSYGLGTAESLGWGDVERQERRFEELVLVGDITDCTVLDVGCGYGDLRAHIDRAWRGVKYIGIDQYSPFLEEASKRFMSAPNTTFLHGDFLSLTLPPVDYVFASGSLSYRSDEPQFIYDAIDKLFAVCRRGLAFNLLSKVDEEDAILCAYDPAEILAHCRRWTTDVELREGYLHGDFTILMRNPAG